MGHILLSSSLYDHPAIRQTSDRGFVLWVRAICWMNQNGRDHMIDKKSMRALVRQLGTTQRAVKSLLGVGLLIEVGDDYFVPSQVGRSMVELYRFGPASTYRPTIPKAVRKLIIDRDGYFCGICSLAVHPDDIHLDHIKPISAGGATTPDNLRVTHSTCNIRKGATWHASE